jgi:hypothetical protein
MKVRVLIPFLLLGPACSCASAQAPPPAEDKAVSTRYSIAVIDDATFFSGMPSSDPKILNQVLVEPTFDLRYRTHLTFSTSLIGLNATHDDNTITVRVKETYIGLSAGDFDFTTGRKIVRWGTGYAFTAAGVLDPPRNPANPGDRLNTNQGRDMIKADWVHGPHALTFAWSTAALAPANSAQRDITAFRYNVLVRGFDTALIAGNERGEDAFGGVTFTRVIGQAWELHGEEMWRDGDAFLIGAKYTLHSGVSFLGEFYTPPNTSYYRDASISPEAGRQYYAFFYAAKSRLRELPGWKEWDVSGSIAANLNDHSFIGVADVSRWFGTHFTTYVHLEVPYGITTSDYGALPYDTSTSVGIRFHL